MGAGTQTLWMEGQIWKVEKGKKEMKKGNGKTGEKRDSPRLLWAPPARPTVLHAARPHACPLAGVSTSENI